MLINSLILIGGFYILIKSADYLVDGASSVAKKLGVSALVIGLTVVAFGTSAPELFVNILSAISGSAPLAVGNVMGSNLANILLILGFTAAIKPVRVQFSTVFKEIPFMLLASVMVLTMSADIFLDNGNLDVLSRTNGISLIGFFLVFIFYTFSVAKSATKEGKKVVKKFPTWKSNLMIFGGLVGLIVGGKLIVDSASEIALLFGVSESLIGLTVVAVGTSLPELATSIIAVKKGQVDLAVGNVVGSNIFNIFLVLGTSATISPLVFSSQNIVDAVVVIAVSLTLYAFMFLGEKHVLQRWQGALFVASYIAYIAYSIFAYTI